MLAAHLEGGRGSRLHKVPSFDCTLHQRINSLSGRLDGRTCCGRNRCYQHVLRWRRRSRRNGMRRRRRRHFVVLQVLRVARLHLLEKIRHVQVVHHFAREILGRRQLFHHRLVRHHLHETRAVVVFVLHLQVSKLLASQSSLFGACLTIDIRLRCTRFKRSFCSSLFPGHISRILETM